MGALKEKDEPTEGERVRLPQLTELRRRKRIVARKPNGCSQHQIAHLLMMRLLEKLHRMEPSTQTLWQEAQQHVSLDSGNKSD